MADIELVIKIPEEIRLALINNIQLSQDQKGISDAYINLAIINGTQLPKGHGDLIDISDIEPMSYTVDGGDYYDNYKAIDWEDIENAPTIIEADKAKSEAE